MFEASYGFPPAKAEDVAWISLHDYIAREGADPDKRRIKPYCPHCKCELLTYDTKGSQGFYLVSQEVSKRPEEIRHLKRPTVGFRHPPKQAKKDCPYSYVNNPQFDYSKYKGRQTAQRERQRNIEFFSDPYIARRYDLVLRNFMYRLTGEPNISRPHRKILKRLTRRLMTHMPGLAEHPWVLPYMQVVLFGAHLRLHPPVAVQQAAEGTKRRMPPRLRAWRPLGVQELTYNSVNDEPRTILVPKNIQINWVHPKNLGVRYVPLLQDGHRAIIFDVTKDWANGIIRARHKEVKKLLRHYRDMDKNGRVRKHDKPQLSLI